ncbi:MAG TPA: hypothetical protein VI248_16475 [Kineosporiaceae bacterium]
MADLSIDSNVHGGPLTGSVTADVVSTLTGLDDIRLTTAGENTVHGDARITLDPLVSTVTVEPLTVDSTLTSTSNLSSTSNLTSTSALTSTSTLDIEPVAVDSCLRLELGPLPPTQVRTPYQQRWSWSVFGVEVFALDLRGSATAHIGADRTPPVVIE